MAATALDKLAVPIVQAGMGGVARAPLAAAVSGAGGLGTIAGALAPIARELETARRLTGGPVAVNLLLPFLGPHDAEAAAGADVVVTFWGEPRRLTGATWIHQCGSVREAKAAAAAGADAVIAQGVEAGGHVRGTTPMLELLAAIRAAVALPVLAAGGIVDRDGVREVLDAGAVAAVVGTRFLLSDECSAHAVYKRRCLEAEDTVLTEMFGLGWPNAPHRVIANAATRRWVGADPRGSAWLRGWNRVSHPLARRVPQAMLPRAAALQRPWLPLFGPLPPGEEAPASLLEAGPLYAGAGVGRIHDVLPAAELVRKLTP